MPDPAQRVVICNTSPLFYLHRIRRLQLLHDLYGTILVPKAVVEELDAARRGGEDAPDLPVLAWVQTRDVDLPVDLRSIVDLGKGEASVIALGLDLGGSALLVIDDRLGRTVAAEHALDVTGTAGILLKAKRLGLVTSVTECLDAMIQAGFYLRKRVYDDIRALAGE